MAEAAEVSSAVVAVAAAQAMHLGGALDALERAEAAADAARAGGRHAAGQSANATQGAKSADSALTTEPAVAAAHAVFGPAASGMRRAESAASLSSGEARLLDSGAWLGGASGAAASGGSVDGACCGGPDAAGSVSDSCDSAATAESGDAHEAHPETSQPAAQCMALVLSSRRPSPAAAWRARAEVRPSLRACVQRLVFQRCRQTMRESKGASAIPCPITCVATAQLRLQRPQQQRPDPRPAIVSIGRLQEPFRLRAFPSPPPCQ